MTISMLNITPELDDYNSQRLPDVDVSGIGDIATIQEAYRHFRSVDANFDMHPVAVNSFNCSGNSLTSLIGGPDQVFNFYNCANNKLTSLDHLASKIGNMLDCSYNKIDSLIGIDDKIPSLRQLKVLHNPVKTGGLGILLIDDLRIINEIWLGKRVYTSASHIQMLPYKGEEITDCLHFSEVISILECFMNRDRDGKRNAGEYVYECQNMLIEANLESYAVI